MTIYYMVLGLVALALYLVWYNLSGHRKTKRKVDPIEPLNLDERPPLSTLDVDARIPLYEDSAPPN